MAVSLILEDKRPAISFLSNFGQHVATGISNVTALQTDLAIVDIDGDSINQGVLSLHR